jgi:hypothetical protein
MRENTTYPFNAFVPIGVVPIGVVPIGVVPKKMVYEKNPLIFFGEYFGFFRLCFGKKESAVSIWVMSLTMFLGKMRVFSGRCL